MDWTEFTIYSKKEALEPIANALDDIGIKSIAIEDPDDMLEFVQNNSDKWDLVDDELIGSIEKAKPNIKVYVPITEASNGMIKNIEATLKNLSAHDSEGIFDGIEFSSELLCEEDWANNWKKYFKPLEIGEKLAIVPLWESYEENGRIIVNIDPGSSFGSGMHETTQMCLNALEDYLIEGDTVVDVGSGSGILSAAAAKLGAGRVVAIDIDPKASEDTLATLKENGVDEKCEILTGDITSEYHGKADIIIGNLFANIIKRLADNVESILKPDGLLITSGIITDTVDSVLDAYEKNNLNIVETVNKGEWYLVVGQKKL